MCQSADLHALLRRFLSLGSMCVHPLHTAHQLFVSSLGIGATKRVGGEDTAEARRNSNTNGASGEHPRSAVSAVGTAAIYAFELPAKAPSSLTDMATRAEEGAATTTERVATFGVPTGPSAETVHPFPLRRAQVYADELLRHPSGLLVHNATLYALDQLGQALLSFDVASGAFLGETMSHLPDKPEDLVLVPDEC